MSLSTSSRICLPTHPQAFSVSLSMVRGPPVLDLPGVFGKI